MLPKKKKAATHINIRQYIENPYKGSAYLASRKMIKQGLNIAFLKLFQKHKKQFFAIPYIDSMSGDILFHVRVPSEEYDINKLTYDVLFQIKYDETIRYALRDIKMFSNSPSFLFTYAYVYYHEHLIIEDFANKIPLEALVNAPTVRNPIESRGYEKSTYFAARYLLDGMCLNDNYINKNKKSLNSFQILTLQNNIADPEAIVQIYALAKSLQVKAHRKVVDKERKVKREELRKSYLERRKVSTPSSSVFKKGPHATITRKAKRTLMNESTRPNRIRKPSKSLMNK